jgi:hypothetical protein
MINIAQFISITPKNGNVQRFQNFFHSENGSAPIPGTTSPAYTFAPFRAEGVMAQLNGENETLQLLFPFSVFAVRLVEAGDGNRLSRLEMKTVWLESNSATSEASDYRLKNNLVSGQYTENYVGIGASFSDTTIELRFKSAMDSVNANFPAQSFTRKNVGLLPLNSDINLR